MLYKKLNLKKESINYKYFMKLLNLVFRFNEYKYDYEGLSLFINFSFQNIPTNIKKYLTLVIDNKKIDLKNIKDKTESIKCQFGKNSTEKSIEFKLLFSQEAFKDKHFFQEFDKFITLPIDNNEELISCWLQIGLGKGVKESSKKKVFLFKDIISIFKGEMKDYISKDNKNNIEINLCNEDGSQITETNNINQKGNIICSIDFTGLGTNATEFLRKYPGWKNYRMSSIAKELTSQKISIIKKEKSHVAD